MGEDPHGVGASHLAEGGALADHHIVLVILRLMGILKSHENVLLQETLLHYY